MQVVLSLNPGGTERLVIDLVSRLHNEFPMAVCCLDDEGVWAESVKRQGVPVTALHRHPGFHPALARGVARAASAHGADVIHAHHYSPFVYSALAGLFSGSPSVILTEHGRLSDTGPSSKRRLANRVLAHLAHATCAVSEDVRRHLIGEGFAAASVRVIYNGVEIGAVPTAAERIAVRAALDVTETSCLIGTIARLDSVKDLTTLIGAVSSAGSRADIRLAIVGDGPERSGLEQTARRLGVGDRVRFLGYRDDARKYLAGFDVYANSSVSEGVSLTILEAMGAALPVVATAVGGTPEVVNESCGRLVSARDPEAFATHLVALALSSSDRRRLGDAARQRVEARFTLAQMIEEYRQLYRACGSNSQANDGRQRSLSSLPSAK